MNIHSSTMAAVASTEKLVFNDNADGFKTFSFAAISKLPVFLRKRRRAAALGVDAGSSVTTTPPVVHIEPAEFPASEQQHTVAVSTLDHQKANSFFAKLSSAAAASARPVPATDIDTQDDCSTSQRDRANSKTFTQTWHSALGRLKSQVDPWSDFQRYPVERCTRYRYQAGTGDWSEDIVLVQIEPTVSYFTRSRRVCFAVGKFSLDGPIRTFMQPL